MHKEQVVLENELKELISTWSKKALKYYRLAEKENDPVGKKFYESSALSTANCVTDLKNLLGIPI